MSNQIRQNRNEENSYGSTIAVSVVVPVYNAEKYLRECMNSILRSTLDNIEVICVDDGSSDASVTIIEEYCKNDKRVRFFRQSNQYAGPARNNGIHHAKGKYLAFIDADDFIDQDSLKKLYGLCEKYKLDILKCSSYLYDASTSMVSTNKWAKNYWAINKIGYNKVCQFNEENFDLCRVADAPWTGLYRTEFIRSRKILFPRLFCCNDHYFSIKCVIEAERMMVTDTFMNYYRQNVSESLIDQKAYHFDCQIKSYQLVSEGVRKLPITLFQCLMQVELESLLYHYNTIIKKNINVENINRIMGDFVRSFDIKEVGEEYFIRHNLRKQFELISKKSSSEVLAISLFNKRPRAYWTASVIKVIDYLCRSQYIVRANDFIVDASGVEVGKIAGGMPICDLSALQEVTEKPVVIMLDGKLDEVQQMLSYWGYLPGIDIIDGSKIRI